MSNFETELTVKELNDDTWELTGTLRYKSDLAGTIEVPAGYVTDFASVPRLPIAYLLAGNIAHEAAVVHDFLYQTHLTSKPMADNVFYEAMMVTGVVKWRAKIMWLAVKFCGQSSYDSGPERKRILKN